MAFNAPTNTVASPFLLRTPIGSLSIILADCKALNSLSPMQLNIEHQRLQFMFSFHFKQLTNALVRNVLVTQSHQNRDLMLRLPVIDECSNEFGHRNFPFHMFLFVLEY